MSSSEKFNFGFFANAPCLVATKKFFVSGSIPANIAGAPSHFVVILILLFELPFNVEPRELK